MDKYKEILEQPHRKNIWQAALYIRLSKEDGDKQESYSWGNIINGISKNI